MINFSDILVIGVFESVDSEFFIKFGEKYKLKGVKCNLCVTVDFPNFLVMEVFKYIDSK